MIKFAADDFLLLTELFFGCDFCEVKGEGCIFNLYIIFFILGFFRFLTLGSFFGFYPFPSRVYI